MKCNKASGGHFEGRWGGCTMWMIHAWNAVFQFEKSRNPIYQNRFIEEFAQSLREVLHKSVRIAENIQPEQKDIGLLDDLGLVMWNDLRQQVLIAYSYILSLKESHSAI